jgi:hypothetical protein
MSNSVSSQNQNKSADAVSVDSSDGFVGHGIEHDANHVDEMSTTEETVKEWKKWPARDENHAGGRLWYSSPFWPLRRWSLQELISFSRDDEDLSFLKSYNSFTPVQSAVH